MAPSLPADHRDPAVIADVQEHRRISRYVWIGFAIAIVLTALVYAPGLKGVYIFDDFPNIVDNVHLHVTSADWRTWMEAIWSSPSTDLHRPLASLSFAVNYFFGGIEPQPMKAVNIAIHLLNGALLLVLLRRVFALPSAAREASGTPDRLSFNAHLSPRDQALALLVTAAWLLHPINLTAVLYVVQRMESLAQIFVLCGLSFYVAARERQIGGRTAGWTLWIGVPACMLLGVSSKESAALLPLYALVAELTIMAHAPRSKRSTRELQLFFGVFLLLPAVLGVAWMMPDIVSAQRWATRPFTLQERLLSEPRVLVDYIRWIILPLPGTFSLFRDDFAMSRSLLQPWTTIPAAAALVGMLAASWFLRRRRPLVALGLAWFLAAHVLTATVVPLELVFEHRNYFAAIGLLLAAIDLVLPKSTPDPLPIVRRALLGLFIIVCGVTTLLRAVEWGNPVRLALSEAANHPTSPRATYELGRVLVVLTGYRADSPVLPRAFAELESAASVPGARTQPDAALIVLAARTGRTVEDSWWQRLARKLRERPPAASDSDALMFLAECARSGACNLDRNGMLDAFYAALSHSPPDPATLYVYAIYAYNSLGDKSLALQLSRDAVRYAPGTPQYRVNLANFLIDLGQLDDAAREIELLRAQNRMGELQAQIEQMQRKLAAASNEAAQPEGSTGF